MTAWYCVYSPIFSTRIVWSIREAAYISRGLDYHLHGGISGLRSHSALDGFPIDDFDPCVCVGERQLGVGQGKGQESRSDYRLSASINHALHIARRTPLHITLSLAHGVYGCFFGCFTVYWEGAAYFGEGMLAWAL